MEPTPEVEAALTASVDDPARGAAALAALPAPALEAALRALVRDRGPEARAVLTALADAGSGPVRRLARRALYRLGQTGVAAPTPPTKPLIERRPERAIRGFMSTIDATGTRVVWIVFEGQYGGLTLCSLLINDIAGVLEVNGGEITKKRLEAELAHLRVSPELAFVEFPPGVVIARVKEARAIHATRGTAPPPEFARWQRLFEAPSPTELGSPDDSPLRGDSETPPGEDDREPSVIVTGDALQVWTPSVHLVEGGTGEAPDLLRLFEVPELAAWSLDPDAVEADAVKLLEARSSRLVLPGAAKGDREAAIVEEVVLREMPRHVRERWARRLREMALIFKATARGDAALLARTAARELTEPDWRPDGDLFAHGLAMRALNLAIEVVSGRMTAEEVSRAPAIPPRSHGSA